MQNPDTLICYSLVQLLTHLLHAYASESCLDIKIGCFVKNNQVVKWIIFFSYYHAYFYKHNDTMTDSIYQLLKRINIEICDRIRNISVQK